jgi:hypothetical protein
MDVDVRTGTKPAGKVELAEGRRRRDGEAVEDEEVGRRACMAAEHTWLAGTAKRPQRKARGVGLAWRRGSRTWEATVDAGKSRRVAAHRKSADGNTRRRGEEELQ